MTTDDEHGKENSGCSTCKCNPHLCATGQAIRHKGQEAKVEDEQRRWADLHYLHVTGRSEPEPVADEPIFERRNATLRRRERERLLGEMAVRDVRLMSRLGRLILKAAEAHA